MERNNHNCHHNYSIRNQKQEDVTLKKSISILLLFTTLVVGTSGFATEYFTIGEVLEQAGTGWHKTYSAHGREIVVDVDAMVPDVKSVPVSKCKYSEYPPNITDGTGLILEHILLFLAICSSLLYTAISSSSA